MGFAWFCWPAGSAGTFCSATGIEKGGRMTLRMRVHDKEPIGLALRRFKKLIERSGMQKELRAHQHYEKPSELRRRARLRKEKAARKARENPV
jgi:small subunit ribosomal protein S21